MAYARAMQAIALALVLMTAPRVHPGPDGVVQAGPLMPSSVQRVDRWLRSADALDVRPDTRWRGRTIKLGHGGWLLLLRERYQDHPIAGARLALRVGPDRRLRQVIGTGLNPALLVDPHTPWPSTAQLWWPTDNGLIPARIEDSPISFAGGMPEQTRRYVDARTGTVLAEESLADEIIVPIQGWPENPLTTPALMTYEVELADLDPIVLEDGVFRVLDCNWSAQLGTCDPIATPISADPNGFPSTPPPLADAAGHASTNDPYAALQFMQFASRLEAKLAQWGWDSYAWDDLDCSWQDTADPADCRVHVYTNVQAQDAQGVFPHAGAVYFKSGKIFMGQGHNADTAYDGDIVVHEIGHHVTWSFGSPEPTSPALDVSRSFTDQSALNEASSDFLARMFGPNDRIYDYFCTIEPGPYDGPTIRDVSIPFRCPDNVVGEVHMDGRIWVSAVMDIFVALEHAGLSDLDSYAIAYYGALAAIRQIPREQLEQLSDARAILLDEIALSFGAQAHDIARDIFDARGVGTCEYISDVRDQPTITGIGDPLGDALAARFLVFKSYAPAVDPAVVDAHPYAPPLQFRVTLGADEGGVALSYVPKLWRPPRPVDSVVLEAAALVKAGEQPVQFTLDAMDRVSNDAQLRFESFNDGERERIVIDGLDPGQTYTIAVVSLSTVLGDKLMMNDMRWELLEATAVGGSESGDTGGSETGDGGSGTSGTDDGPVVAGDGGCTCTTSAPRGGPWFGFGLFALLLVRRPGHDRRGDG